MRGFMGLRRARGGGRRRKGWKSEVVGLLVLCALQMQVVSAVNWAQLSGDRMQKTAETVRSPYSGRWGAAVAVVENRPPSDEVLLPESQRSRLFLLGGDDYSVDPGEGSFRNDIWSTTGFRTVAVNSLIERNAHGALLPKIVSRLRWVEVAGDRTPPSGVGYRDWLCCITSNMGLWDCLTEEEGAEVEIQCEPVDPFVGARRWSPRRDHRAIADGEDLYVLGGRARALEDIPEDEAIGGLLGARRIEREKAVLMSDIWKSTDFGATWELLTPGCYVPQPDLVDAPGVRIQECTTSADCFAARLGDAECVDRVCVCNLWSPRERFAASLLEGRMFVAGGVATVTSQRCEQFACGEEVQVVLNDVWRSGDAGQYDLWEQITAAAPWAPRAEMDMVVYDSTLWLVGGRGFAPQDLAANRLFADVWKSSNGIDWEANITRAPWKPRASHKVVVVDGLMVMHGGYVAVPTPPPPPPLTAAEQAEEAAASAPVVLLQDQEAEAGEEEEELGEVVSGMRIAPTDEVWTWVPGEETPFAKDFARGGSHEAYFRASDPIQFRLNLTQAEAAVLAEFDIFTVEDLAEAEASTLRILRGDGEEGKWLHEDGEDREICFFFEWASLLQKRCRVVTQPFDGEFVRSVHVVEAGVEKDRVAAYGGYWLTEGSMQRIDESAAARAAALAATGQGDDATGTDDAGDGGTDDTAGDGTDDAAEAAADTAELLLGGRSGCGDRAGKVTVPAEDVDVPCREVPSARHSAVLASMDGRAYVLSGYEAQSSFASDVWYRDDRVPATVLTTVPQDASSDTVFDFACSEVGCLFEWRLYAISAGAGGDQHLGQGTPIRGWNKQLPPVDLEGTLEAGNYRFEVRSVDPAGNRDPVLVHGVNVYSWEYVPPLPVLLIVLLILFFLIAVGVGIWYYRRWRRRRLLERYAMKRIERKIRAVAEGDWKTQYKKKGKKKKKKGKGRGKKALEREKRRRAAGKTKGAKRKAKAKAKGKGKGKKKGKKK